MKIAVFNCPGGVTGEGILHALLDAGLSRSYLRKEWVKSRSDRKARRSIIRILGALERAQIYLSDRRALTKLAEVAIGLRYFQIEKCFVRNLAIGKKGNARTLKLLQGFAFERLPVKQELVTPDGGAIIAALCEKTDRIPAMRLDAVGLGPENLMVSIGETVAPYRRERILLLETNIDDMSPQGFELVYERLFKAGALDVWVQPILMKKMRPAFKLSVLLNHVDQEKISEVIFKETPTLGVRFLELDRLALPRKVKKLKTRFGTVRMKVGWLDSRHRAAFPEYEDVKRISQKKGWPFSRVYRFCQAAASDDSESDS